MPNALRVFFAAALLTLAQAIVPTSAVSQDSAWRVSKVSGDVLIGSPGAQQVSVSSTTSLKPGDTIRTGRNGRVLLVRGAETILISANSQVVVPISNEVGRTTILQQAGTILLDVEKRNVQHFDVETPFLAAVVKGTQFQVTVTPRGAKVNVQRGQVEVADFRSGQFALVQPGQAASVSGSGVAGLNLSGSGSFNAIQQGAPRAPTVRPLAVPPGGLVQPASGQQARPASGSEGSTPAATVPNGRAGSVGGGVVRIGAPLGEVRVNVHAATGGLARDGNPGQGVGAARGQAAFWSTGENAPGNVSSGTGSRGNSTGANSDSAFANAKGQANAQGNGNASHNAVFDRGAGKVHGASGNEGVGNGKDGVGSGNGNRSGNMSGNGNRFGNGHGNNGKGNNGNGNANSGGNGSGNGKGNAGGDGNGNGNGNAGGNGKGKGNGNSGGNGTGTGNSNAGGNGNGNGNAGGNGNGNGNAGGNGNGNGNGNAGGNGNGSLNGNAGGNGNGNGRR
jgi:hypothetical protein